MKRLCLVQLPVPQPAALAATGNVPLAAGYLGVSAQVHGLPARGLAIEVLAPALTDVLGDTQLAEHIARSEPDFVGFSLYLWNVERSLHVARLVKRLSPRTRILIGGPEVSADNPFVLGQQGYDIAVTGEAEDTFAHVMGKLLDGADVRGLPGVALRSPLGLGPFGPAPRTNFPLTEYPSPYLAGLVPVDPERSTYVESVRGCRSHCAYCFYPRSSNVLRTLDVGQTADLIAALRDRGARELVFLDPTFNHRPEFEPLLDALIDVNRGAGLTFFGEIRAEGLTAVHAKKLAQAGFTKLEIGLQSVNLATLKRVKRGGSPAKVAEAASMLREHGVDLLVDLMIGLPGDTEDDVARGVDFLLEHGLAEHAQVFPLSLLPGTALRASAESDGVSFDPAPPYRVLGTATLDRAALRRCLLDAEERLGRRLDEEPRPHLVAENPAHHDVFTLDLERDVGVGRAGEPGAQHVALWLRGRDLWGARERVLAALDARLAVDPYAVLDVVLEARAPFPLELLELVRARLEAATPSYASRALALRGENLQRRLVVVVPTEAALPASWLEAVQELVPVYREQRAHEALRDAERLGDDLPFARIVDDAIPRALWSELVAACDPACVSFRARDAERAWVRGVLEHGVA
jgi:Radical SAM superfamily/B12 binding domain